MSEVTRDDTMDGAMLIGIRLDRKDQEEMGAEIVEELEASLREVVAAASGTTRDPEADAIRGRQALRRLGRRAWRFLWLCINLFLLAVALRILVYVAVAGWEALPL